MSHVGGFYAAYLLAHRKVVAATAVAVFVKGVGLLIALWIFQACRPALMTIGWFAWGHGKLEAARRWAVAKVRPLWSRGRRLLRRMVMRSAERGSPHAGRRLKAIRAKLLKRFGGTG